MIPWEQQGGARLQGGKGRLGGCKRSVQGHRRIVADSGEGDKWGVKATGSRDTLEATATDTDDAGEGGFHRAENGEGRGVVIQRENQDFNSFRVE